MRIIAGRLGGRMFDSPPGHRTHPMSEKIRGAIFNALGDMEGLKVLDAYAGSGALGLEAISHGAAQVVAIEHGKAAYTSIQRNAQILGIQNGIRVYCMNVRTWVQEHADQRFDVIFADPPYDDVKPEALTELAGLLAQDGVMVLSLPPSIDAALIPLRLELVQHKSYNDAHLWFYKRC